MRTQDLIKERIRKLNSGEILCNNKNYTFAVWNGRRNEIIYLKKTKDRWILNRIG